MSFKLESPGDPLAGMTRVCFIWGAMGMVLGYWLSGPIDKKLREIDRTMNPLPQAPGTGPVPFNRPVNTPVGDQAPPLGAPKQTILIPQPTGGGSPNNAPKNVTGPPPAVEPRALPEPGPTPPSSNPNYVPGPGAPKD